MTYYFKKTWTATMLSAVLLASSAAASSVPDAVVEGFASLDGSSSKAQADTLFKLNQWFRGAELDEDTVLFVTEEGVPEIVRLLSDFRGPSVDAAILLLTNMLRELGDSDPSLAVLVSRALVPHLSDRGVHPMRQSGALQLMRASGALEEADILLLRELFDEGLAVSAAFPALQVFGNYYHKYPAARQVFLESLQSPDANRRRAALRAADSVRPLDAAIVAEVGSSLRDPDPETQRMVFHTIQTLATIDGHALKGVVPPLTDMVRSNETEVGLRALSARTLGYVAHASQDRDALMALEELIRDDSNPIGLRRQVLKDFPFSSKFDPAYAGFYAEMLAEGDSALSDAAEVAQDRFARAPSRYR